MEFLINNFYDTRRRMFLLFPPDDELPFRVPLKDTLSPEEERFPPPIEAKEVLAESSALERLSKVGKDFALDPDPNSVDDVVFSFLASLGGAVNDGGFAALAPGVDVLFD